MWHGLNIQFLKHEDSVRIRFYRKINLIKDNLINFHFDSIVKSRCGSKPKNRSSCVIARPIPVLPPVTIATFPLNNPVLNTLVTLETFPVVLAIVMSCDFHSVSRSRSKDKNQRHTQQNRIFPQTDWKKTNLCHSAN